MRESERQAAAPTSAAPVTFSILLCSRARVSPATPAHVHTPLRLYPTMADALKPSLLLRPGAHKAATLGAGSSLSEWRIAAGGGAAAPATVTSRPRQVASELISDVPPPSAPRLAAKTPLVSFFCFCSDQRQLLPRVGLRARASRPLCYSLPHSPRTHNTIPASPATSR